MKIFSLSRRLLNLIRYHMTSEEDFARSIGVKIGKECKIATRTFGSEPYLIEIGDHVHITSGVSFITHDGGVWVFRKEDPSFDVFGPIKIGSNTYIGSNTTILPGISIGNNCVIGTRSVVTKSIPDDTVAAGSPCRYICSISEYHSRMLKPNAKTKLMNARQKREVIMALKDDNLIQKKLLGSNIQSTTNQNTLS